MSRNGRGGESQVQRQAEVVLDEARAAGDTSLALELPGVENTPEETRRDTSVPAWKRTLKEAANYRELRRTPYGLRPLYILLWTSLFVGINQAITSIALPDVLDSIDLNSGSYFRYTGFVGVVVVLLHVWVAFRADGSRRTRMVGFSLIAGGIGSALTSTAPNSFVFGLGDTTSTALLYISAVPVFSLLADYYPPEVRGKVFALSAVFTGVGSTLVPVFVGEITDAFGWRATYMVTAIPVVLIAILVLLRLPEPVRGYMERRALGATEDEARIEDERPSFAETWRTVMGIRTLRRLFVANIVAGPGLRLFQFASIVYFFDFKGLNIREVAYLSAISAAIVLPGAILSGGIVDSLLRRRPSRVIAVFAVIDLIAIIPIIFFGLKASLVVVVALNGFVALVEVMTGPAMDTLIAQITPANIRNTGQAVIGLSRLSRLLLGAYLTDLVLSTYDFSTAYWLSIPFIFFGALVRFSAAGLFEFDMRSAFAANLANAEWRKAKEAGKDKLLVCRNIDVAYSGVQVLFGVDFDVEEGEVIALLGTNGAGKSTLLRAISGLTTASGGAVVFDGRDITFMPPNEAAARGVVFMPGGRGVFPGLTVRENLLLGTWLMEDEQEIRERLEEVIRIFPSLVERAETPAGLLSGGEQQQLSLALAFLAKPRLLMIDELSLGLAPAVVGQLVEIVKELNRQGITIIVVEQSVNVALTIAERAIFMEKGEVKFIGKTADLLRRPDILRAVYVKGTGALTTGGGGGSLRTARERRALELANARPILQVDGVTKRFGGITAVDGVNLEVRDGEVIGLIGPNGSGKTTLFELISGFQPVDDGIVNYDGTDITNLSPEERARRGIIRRFQDAALFPSLTVFETLLVALEQRHEAKSTIGAAISLPRNRKAERRLRDRADRLIDILELGAYRDKFVKELSTGLRRIVDLACVLANDPRLLLLDEPSSGIAQAEAEGLAPLLKRVQFETGCSILIIEHDMPLISAVSDELVALERGSVITRGSPEDVLNNERVIEAYLGTSDAAIQRSGSIV